MQLPDLSEVSGKALGTAFAEWVTAMQQENWWYRPEGMTADQAAANRAQASARLAAVLDTRQAVIEFIAEYRHAHPAPAPTDHDPS